MYFSHQSINQTTPNYSNQWSYLLRQLLTIFRSKYFWIFRFISRINLGFPKLMLVCWIRLLFSVILKSRRPWKNGLSTKPVELLLGNMPDTLISSHTFSALLALIQILPLLMLQDRPTRKETWECWFWRLQLARKVFGSIVVFMRLVLYCDYILASFFL